MSETPDAGHRPDTDQAHADRPTEGQEPQVVVVGPEGMASVPTDGESEHRSVADMVEQPDKVMRIGRMINQLLDEVKAAPLDEASRTRLADIHTQAIAELQDGLAPELVAELERLTTPFTQGAPSDAELRIAQAQLVGWLEGLFHGIQTTIYAQQMAARAQLEQMRRLPPGPGGPGQQSGPAGPGAGGDDGHPGGLYL